MSNFFRVDLPFNYTRASKAAVGAYVFGDMLGYGVDDGLVKVMSASQNMVGAGVCQETKTTLSTSESVIFLAGVIFPISASTSAPPTAGKAGQLCYASGFGAGFKTTLTAGTNPLLGRVYQVDADGSGLNNVAVHIDHHLFPSGSAL